MAKTAIGLFDNAMLADAAVREIAALGLPRNEIRILGEPLDFAVTGVMSIARVDFEVELTRELMRIGATEAEAETYVDAVRHGSVMIFATGPDQKVDDAARIMNRRSAAKTEEVVGGEPYLPPLIREESVPEFETSVQAGRVRNLGDGACVFVW